MTDATAWFAFSGQRLLLRVERGARPTLPGERDVAALMPRSGIAPGGAGSSGDAAAGDATPGDPTPVNPLDVSIGGWVARAVELDEALDPSDGFVLSGLREAHALLPGPLWSLAGRAFQLLEWRRSHRFCGRCGAPNEPHGSERAMTCLSCGQLHFPRIAPAVIVLVEREGRALLGRSPHFRPGVFSTLAGFVEPGESLEEAVRREVLEEVGIAVDDVRYFGSQPWPFPHSLMVGFTARWAGGEIEPDGDEVVEAGWYAPDALPGLPTSFSIARLLIDDFVARAAGPGRGS